MHNHTRPVKYQSMRILVNIFVVALVLLTADRLYPRELATIVFYNVENFYDTIPDVSGRDSDYTPMGRIKWDSVKYSTKLVNIARVLDAIEADLVGIAEIESETAVRDLVMTLKTDYNYIFKPSGDYRGMDLALLYKGDKFVPEESRRIHSGSSRDVLYVKGELCGERIDILVCHLPSQINSARSRDQALQSLYWLASAIHDSDWEARVVLVGDFNADPADRLMRRRFFTNDVAVDGRRPLFSPLASLADRGVGSYVYNNRWLLYDNIFLSTRFLGGNGFRYFDSGVFLRPWMLDEQTVSRRGYPLRTFSSGAYLGGFSDHLPVFVSLVKD